MSESSSESRGPSASSAKVIVFAGGGTGGHLYPALAIAEQLRELDPRTRCVFLCSPRPIDAKILADESAEFHVIPAQPLGLHPSRLFRFLRSWRPAVQASRRSLRELTREGAVHVVAMGGFVAAPVVQAARAERLPVTLVNLDAVPGKANRWIALRADRILDAASSGAWPRATTIRPIVRRAAVAGQSKEECRASLGLAPDTPTLFITGGSQGARTINDLMTLLLRDQRSMFAGWQVYHQTGPPRHSEADMQRAYDEAPPGGGGVPARAVEFCRTMGLAWGAADLSIARCGAGAVAEVWANAVPAVFLPYPFHRDHHQQRNAQPLVDAGGALLFRDWVNSPKTASEVGPALRMLLTDRARRNSMRAALQRLGPADGAFAVASVLLGKNTQIA